MAVSQLRSEYVLANQQRLTTNMRFVFCLAYENWNGLPLIFSAKLRGTFAICFVMRG